MTKKSGAARYVSLLTLPLAVALCLVFAEKVPAKTTNESKVLTETSLPKTTGQQIRNNAIDVKPELNSVAEKTVSDTIPAKKTQSVPVKNNKTEKAVTTALPSQTPPPAPLVAQTIVDVMPEFPGGFNEFRKLIGAQFDTSKINPEEDMQKSEVTFVVLPDGTTANFETKGDNAAMNAELLRTAKAVSEGKIWKPAEKDGKPVAYMFKVPITMNFEKPKTAK